MSERVLSVNDSEPCEETGRGREREEPDAAAKRAKVQKDWVTKMARIYREEPLGDRQPRPWAVKLRIEGKLCQPFPVAARNRGMQGESGSQVCSDVKQAPQPFIPGLET